MNNTIKRRGLIFLATCIISALFLGLFNQYYNDQVKKVTLSIEIQSDKVDEYSVYYDDNGDKIWSEETVIKQAYTATGSFEKLNFEIPMNAKNIRIDFGNSPADINVKSAYFKANGEMIDLFSDKISNLKEASNDINLNLIEQSNLIKSEGNDPYLILANINTVFEALNNRPMYLNIIMISGSIILGFIMSNALSN
ncbi:MAG: hypothetical protein ACRC2K_14075, partial [Clostridium sp.]